MPGALIGRLRARGAELLLSAKARFSPTERQRLFGLTIAIGGVCGLVAVAFHLSIRWVEGATIDRALALPLGELIPAVLAILGFGALLAGIALVHIPGARGSGIPQVKVAYIAKSMKLRARDSIAKFFIGSLQIGTGSSLGREGPTVQICAGVAKAMGRIAGVSAHNIKLLLPVGVAAGIAAAFNAPIAAVTFTIEEIVGKLDQTLLSGVIVAAALAAVVERSILGENPVIAIPAGFGLDHASSLALYAGLGVAAALLSVAFTDGLLVLRAKFRGSRIPPWAQPAVGAFVTGLIAVSMIAWRHVDGITGGGYPALHDALNGNLAVDTLLVLSVCKLAATVFSYSSGGAGGIFAPSLVMGAMLGGAFGSLDVDLFGHGTNEVGAFALVGMGAVFAGVVRAPITSVLIIIEMTGGYGLTLPLMISNMMAYALARHLRPLQVYEALLVQDGIALHEEKRPVDAIDRLTIEGARLQTVYTHFTAEETAKRMIETIGTASNQSVFPVLDATSTLVGIVTLDDLTMLADETDLDLLVRAADIMRPPTALRTSDSLGKALQIMNDAGVRQLPITDGDRRVIGLLDEVTIVRDFLRLRAARIDPSTSGVHPRLL